MTFIPHNCTLEVEAPERGSLPVFVLYSPAWRGRGVKLTAAQLLSWRSVRRAVLQQVLHLLPAKLDFKCDLAVEYLVDDLRRREATLATESDRAARGAEK